MNSRAFSVRHCPSSPEGILQLIADRDEPLRVDQLVVAVVRFRQRSERDPDGPAFEFPDYRLVEELLFERECLKPFEWRQCGEVSIAVHAPEHPPTCSIEIAGRPSPMPRAPTQKSVDQFISWKHTAPRAPEMCR
jgi:hypothetical protein